MKIPRNPFSDETEDFQAPHIYMTAAVVGLFVILFLRLWYLQIIRGPELRIKSESNRTRIQDTLPPRGLILDRNGSILVDNFPTYDLAVIPEDVSNVASLSGRLAYYLGRPINEVQERLNPLLKGRGKFKPKVLYTGLTREQLVAIETHSFEMPGIQVLVRPSRRYHYEGLGSHVLGYLGEISKKQLESARYADYKPGDIVGRYGVEHIYENYLHGQRGHRLMEVNASGRVLKIIRKQEPRPGNTLHLTIDADLQQAAQDALGDWVGAIVALNPKNGEVLALASAPSYNLADFVGGISVAKWKALKEDPKKPLGNRAVGGQYPPGSTFKIVTAAAALEDGVISLKDKIKCNGSYPFYDRVFKCWNKSGHGRVDLHQSIRESCDIYYYEVGHRLGINRLAYYSRLFGLGQKTGIGFADEETGLVADTEWKKKKYGKRWLQGETLSVAIGQGYNLATPMQMAQVTAVAANGGILYRPHLVRKITDPSGKLVKFFKPEVIRRLDFHPETFRDIRSGLSAVVNEPRGTGKNVKLENILVGGKTGTSQVVNLTKYRTYKPDEIPYKYRDHAWFVAFAPVDNPEIALAVLLEHAGGGGKAAAPIAKKVLEAFFRTKKVPSPGELTSTEGHTEPGE